MIRGALGSRYGIQGALGRSVKRAAATAFAPTDISGCNLWIDFSDADTLFTDAGSTKVSSDGDAIYRANDKSGNNNHLNQATSSKRPLYKTNIKNGLSVSRYDTTDDKLMLTNPIDLLTGSTMFFISQTSSSSFPRGVFGADGKANTQWRYTNSTTLGFAQTGAPGMNFYWPNIVAANLTLFSFRLQPSPQVLECYANGQNKYTDNSWTATSCWITMCGDSYEGQHCLGGDISEWIIYNSFLSDNDRDAVTTYLNNKWAIYS